MSGLAQGLKCYKCSTNKVIASFITIQLKASAAMYVDAQNFVKANDHCMCIVFMHYSTFGRDQPGHIIVHCT